MTDDILLNKFEIIERCIKRIKEEYSPDNLRNNITKQDSMLLNLERSVQATIDMAMRVCKNKRLGIPKESREAFSLMYDAKLIDDTMLKKMYGLVGFRNTAVHNYKKLDLDIIDVIINKNLQDLNLFANICLKS